MARTKGMLNLSGNLEVNAGAPLDARSVVPTVADLTIASNFQYKYIGMSVTVQATGDMYTLLANDVTDINNWKQVGSGGGGTSYTAGDGIVIDNDEISVDEMASADMSEIVTPLPSVMSRLPRYSTEEQIVAYWIDGKPIYQTTVAFTTGSSSDTNINHNISNIDKVINSAGFIMDGGNYKPFGFYATSSAYISLFVSTTQLKIRAGGSDQYNKSGYATIQYTKITD